MPRKLKAAWSMTRVKWRVSKGTQQAFSVVEAW